MPQARLAALVVLGAFAAAAPAPKAMRGAVVQNNDSMPVVQHNGTMPEETEPGADWRCSAPWGNCRWTQCCRRKGFECYQKHQSFAQCRPTGWCEPGRSQGGGPDGLPWTCCILPDGCAGSTSTTTPTMTTTPTSTTTATTTSTTTGLLSSTTPGLPPFVPCRDYIRRCERLSHQGVCYWLPRLCPRSCGLCH